MQIDNQRFVIDLEYWRVVAKGNTPQGNLDYAEAGGTPACRWAALEWLSEVNFSNCGRTESDHRYFAKAAWELSHKLLHEDLPKLRNIPRNYICLLQAIEECSGDWLNHHPVKNQYLTWRER